MGQRLIRFDDLDGIEDDTVTKREFSVGRVGWEIDLSDENYAELLATLERFTAKAKKVRGPGIKVGGPRLAPTPASVPTLVDPTGDPDDDPGTGHPPAVRFVDAEEPARLATWAAGNNVLLARPGRPPRSVLAAFRADNVEMVPERYRLATADA